MQGALLTHWTPDRRHSWNKPNTTHLDPHLPLELKDCLGLLDGEGGEEVPTFGQLLLFGVGLEARVGLATRDMVDDTFSPPEVEPGSPVCTHHPLFLSRSAHDISPISVHAGDILMLNGAHEMKVVKGDSTDGDVEVTLAFGAILPPTRPAPAWQLLHAEPAWKQAKESKNGTTVTCPCEFEVCIVLYPVLARSSRHCAAHPQMLHIRSGMQVHEFRAKFARIWHEKLYYSLSFHSQEQWRCWLPDLRAARATHARKRFRPARHIDATA